MQYCHNKSTAATTVAIMVDIATCSYIAHWFTLVPSI
jgi:hypothetical protein